MSPRESSVQQLCAIYNVVMGVALSLAIREAITSSGKYVGIDTEHILILLAFLVTIIPFHQGAVRHLQAIYVEGNGRTSVPKGALAFDFLLLFSEGCLFVAMAVLVKHVNAFAYILIAVFILDSIWGFLSWLVNMEQQAQTSARTWSLINVCATVGFILLVICGSQQFGGWYIEMEQGAFAICVIRTIADYYLCWNFYFPDP